MTRPIIGVTTSRRSGWRIFPLVAANIRRAGGRSVRWVAGRDADINRVDGIVVGGGDDILPDLYHGELVASARLDPDRDGMEHDLVQEALRFNKPVLGICRGAQMLNVALGGSLHQDAYRVYTSSRKVWTILPKKRVTVEPESRLARIAGTAPMVVNALHSQAVDRCGEGLQVAARDEGGMIQAIERTAEPFALGVQWHPEHLFYARRQRAIFRALVDAARAGIDQRSQLAASTEAADAPGSI